MRHDPLFARIAQLYDVGAMAKARVLIAGCGAGGGAVALQLAMSGVSRFTLADNDVLEIENVIRHVCGRRHVGLRKTEALGDVLRDRNPAIEIAPLDIDLLSYPHLDEAVMASDLVIIATDNEPTRYRLNEACVRIGKPFVVGRVFTRGIGGEVFAYRPDTDGGCLACLERVLERTLFREGVREIDLVGDDDRDAVYGLEVAAIKDSPGLTVDISFITAFHARLALDAIASALPARPAHLAPIAENYLIWGNRPVHPFSKNFELQRARLRRQDGCLVCGDAA